MKHLKLDIVYIGILIVFSLAIWLPSRYYPLFWDSTYVVKTASQIYDSNFSKLISQEQGYAHPTLFPTFLAILWKLFGTDASVGHYLTLPFLPLLLISSYFVIKQKTNREFGLIGSMLIAFTPVVLAEYLNVYTDLPMAALVALSTLFWTQKKYVLWAVIYGAAILTKIPAITVLPYFVVAAIQTKNKRAIIYSLIAPLSTLAGWFIYHRIVSGWWFIYTERGYTLSIVRNFKGIFIEWLQIIITIVTSQGKWVITTATALSLVLLQKNIRNRIPFQIGKELLVIVSAALLFAATGEFGYRYAIFLHIFFYSAVLSIIYTLTTQNFKFYKPTLITLFGILIYLSTIWHPKQQPFTTNVFTPPDDVGIVDYIQVFRWLTSYVTVNSHENIVYYGGFPESISLLEPKMGFVAKASQFRNCDQYSYDSSIKQIIIMHPFSPTTYPCYQIIQANNLQAITGHEVNGKWIDLYIASQSASPKQK